MKTVKEYSEVLLLSKGERNLTYHMRSLGEYWILPALAGRKGQCLEGGKTRYIYMKELDGHLKELLENGKPDEVERAVSRSQGELEKYIGAGYWIGKRKMYPEVIW